MMGITGGQCVVELFRKEGVKKVFGVPGESYLSVLDALYDCIFYHFNNF